MPRTMPNMRGVQDPTLGPRFHEVTGIRLHRIVEQPENNATATTATTCGHQKVDFQPLKIREKINESLDCPNRYLGKTSNRQQQEAERSERKTILNNY